MQTVIIKRFLNQSRNYIIEAEMKIAEDNPQDRLIKTLKDIEDQISDVMEMIKE